MASWLSRLVNRRQASSPEELIDAVIRNMKHRLTEARLQALAAKVARVEIADPSLELYQSQEAIAHGIAKLEATLSELESKRSILIARTRDADARLAIERSLMEVDAEPAQVALDMLADRASEAEAEADAIAEVRQFTSKARGNFDV